MAAVKVGRFSTDRDLLLVESESVSIPARRFLLIGRMMMSVYLMKILCDEPDCSETVEVCPGDPSGLSDRGWEKRGNEDERHVCQNHTGISTADLYKMLIDDDDD